MQPLGPRQSAILDVLERHAGGLVVARVHDALPGIRLKLLVQAVDRLEQRGIVTVTRRAKHDRAGDLVELRIRVLDASDAPLPAASRVEAGLARPGAP